MRRWVGRPAATASRRGSGKCAHQVFRAEHLHFCVGMRLLLRRLACGHLSRLSRYRGKGGRRGQQGQREWCWLLRLVQKHLLLRVAQGGPSGRRSARRPIGR